MTDFELEANIEAINLDIKNSTVNLDDVSDGIWMLSFPFPISMKDLEVIINLAGVLGGQITNIELVGQNKSTYKRRPKCPTCGRNRYSTWYCKGKVAYLQCCHCHTKVTKEGVKIEQ